MSQPLKRKARHLVDAKIGKQIRAEAKALHLSQKEYLRLTLALSKALRESFGNSTGVSPRQLLDFVESPLFSLLLKGLVQTAISTVNAQTEDSSNTNEAQAPYTNALPSQSPGPGQRPATPPQWNGYSQIPRPTQVAPDEPRVSPATPPMHLFWP